jgi:hypothetical protein
MHFNKTDLLEVNMRYALFITSVLSAALLVAAPTASADARNYRVSGNVRYEILEAKDIYIYSTDVLVRKGTSEKAFFFSAGPNGDIMPLTILNLKNAFPNNHAFHDNLDMAFKHDSDLTKYDDFHKMFRVNRLLLASER